MTEIKAKKNGWIVGVEGPVVEVKFDASLDLPGIYEVLETKTQDGRKLVLEVSEHRKWLEEQGIYLSPCFWIRNAPTSSDE